MQLRRNLLMQMIGGSSVIIKRGSFKLTERTRAQDFTITHGLGVIPQIFIIDAPDYDDEILVRDGNVVYGLYCSANSSQAANGAAMEVGYYTNASAETISYATLNSTNAGRGFFEEALTAQTCCGISYNNNYRYAPDVTYNWVAIAGL